MNRMAVPETLPEMPVLTNLPKASGDKVNVASYFSQEIQEEIPYFEDVETEQELVEPPVLEDIPVLDIEEKTKRYHDYRHKHLSKPLFVRTDNYSMILNTVDTMKNYVDESAEIVYSLENLKKNADIEHVKYKNTLEDIQRKIIYVDKVLFGSKVEG
jgi:hypothetical protein